MKVILVTGATSGIGKEAVSQLISRGGHTVLLVGRTLEKAAAACDDILSKTNALTHTQTKSTLVPFGCELTCKDSIDALAESVGAYLEESAGNASTIDSLCLNAGMAARRGSVPEYVTIGGRRLERTLASNHFGPFYLLHRLIKYLSKGGRIVLTASGVHKARKGKGPSYEEFDGVKHVTSGVLRLQIPSLHDPDPSRFDSHAAYCQSKLCNVSTAGELGRRLRDRGSAARVYCFCPGLITSTGLWGAQNRIFVGLFGFAMNSAFKIADTEEWGGGALAWLASDDGVDATATKDPSIAPYFKAPNGISRRPEGGTYEENFVPSEISAEAADEEKARELWKLSADLMGLDCEEI
mmetsp:Transcript_39529/g.77217  ORF Transcript_39529/g.77217 Transcript_39529/m.77217 type:complete len:353 (-) Transcript_39529:46-1104(-)|eukprot:CAMPEP_0194325018 /NCGR_PEP_ID=MMETSP0171-20130528/28990_1 /TAXON_ID=218684 /ORGANISM="Corethron pennatum, Strain L29A3" /LENGTH=352 /DNA_ID=CAMNT_0039084025 /DNA_START=19 /DNA_END=1077 /DNA_ORIENTATION=+